MTWASLCAAKDHPDRLPALEWELNALVYQAYGLDKDDIMVIEGGVAGHQEQMPNEENTHSETEE